MLDKKTVLLSDARAEAFYEAEEGQGNFKSLVRHMTSAPVCVLVGAGGTVLETAVSTTRQAGGRLVIGWDTGGSGEGRSVPGDGRVRRASGVPPAEHGVPHRVVETNLAHMALVCENAAQVVALANALSREANGRSLPRSHSAVPSPAPGFPHGQRIVKPLTIGDGQGRGWDRSGEASELARA